MRHSHFVTAMILASAFVLGMFGCASDKGVGSGAITMGSFSGGSVTFGKQVTNISRVSEAEPEELSKTIHNQVLTVFGKYNIGGLMCTADYDLVFGPYPPDSPNVGNIKIVESPGSDHVPEIEIISGYAAVGGSWPITRGPKTRTRTTGTRFATVVKPNAGTDNYTIYVILLHQTGSEDVVAESTDSGGPSEKITSKDKFCKVTVTAGVVTSIDPEASISSGDTFVRDFYDWVKKMVDAADLRN